MTAIAQRSSLASAFAGLPEGVIFARGWRRRAIAFVAGAAGAFALPPYGLFVLMAVPMTAAVWLIDGSQVGRATVLTRLKAAFGAGWWLGFGYFLAGLWWIGAACLVDGDKFLWALPLGVVALPAGLAVFTGAGFALAALLWPSGPLRVFALAFGLGLSEWARGLVFTGFPWNDLGMALGANLTLAQIASVVGLHGLTFIAIADLRGPRDALAAPGNTALTGAYACRGPRARGDRSFRRGPPGRAGQRDRPRRQSAVDAARR